MDVIASPTSDPQNQSEKMSLVAGLKFDIERLKVEIDAFVKKYPFSDINQLCLTSRNPNQHDPYDGAGTLYDFKNGGWRANEKDFRYWNPSLENTYLKEVYETVCRSTHWGIGRVRIMKLMPKRCYSVHTDETFRLHLAIETNPQVFMIFYPDQMVHIPSDGQLYFTNTMTPHTAMNGGQQERIHLVFSTVFEI